MSRAANPLRGESTIAIDGRTILLRPSFEALVAVEAEIGSLFGLVERAAQGELTVTEIAKLVWHCMPEDDRPDLDSVGKAIVAMGLAEAIKPVRVILGEVIRGRA